MEVPHILVKTHENQTLLSIRGTRCNSVGDTMTIKIGGQVFKGLKWYVDEVGYHSGPFHIVEQRKDIWDVYVDSDKALHQNSLAECVTWCNNHARQALVFSSRLVVIE